MLGGSLHSSVLYMRLVEGDLVQTVTTSYAGIRFNQLLAACIF